MSAREIPLSKGLVALVDEDDYERASTYKWHAIKRGRLHHAMRSVKRGGVRSTVYLHRWLMDAPTGIEVDHRNGDGLDNRRENLRLATHAKNAVNHRRRGSSKSSAFHGVCWHTWSQRWRVVICAGPKTSRGTAKQIYVGVFRDETDAARAYDRAALIHHGEFAVTNFPREDYR
jgi:hypothetical protein